MYLRSLLRTTGGRLPLRRPPPPHAAFSSSLSPPLATPFSPVFLPWRPPSSVSSSFSYPPSLSPASPCRRFACTAPAAAPAAAAAAATATRKESYKRLDPISHVLLRPGMYVGPVVRHKQQLWLPGAAVGDTTTPLLPGTPAPEGSATAARSAEGEDSAAAHRMHYREASYVPALYKIFDEILVNAADNYQRDRTMRTIDVHFDAVAGSISVRNDGRGIPVRLHQTEQVYVPELVLGNLLTGSNFDDSEGRLTGGTHGFGAKLTNIFSNEFTVETADLRRKKLYRQTWTRNMRERQEPSITDLPSGCKGDYTLITFRPDFSRFGMPDPAVFWGSLPHETQQQQQDDTLAMMRRRVWDVAGVNPGLEVTMDGETLDVDSFLSYVSMFGGRDDRLMYIRPNRHWELVAGVSTDGRFQQVSFVNSLTTIRGGTHVNTIVEQLCRRIADYTNRTQKGIPNVTPSQVRGHLRIFVNALIENPSFDSQLKESLTTPVARFGSSPVLSERFTKQLMQDSGIVEAVVRWAQARERVEFLGQMKNLPRRNSARLLGIPKLEDANDAGDPEHSSKCTLILTEGDSAKALAVAGLAVIGRDRYGVFPLRGKPLNVRDAGLPQIGANEEIRNLVQIMGLDYEKTYRSEEDLQTLRYGSIMIMADQDHDGSHIKGLVLNALHCLFPALLERDGFVQAFVTPIVKARAGRSASSKTGSEMSFYSLPEYEAWRAGLPQAEQKGGAWTTKYYKGLGTSTAQEAREYFGDLDAHIVPFCWGGERDGERLDMAFRKSRSEDRKQWLSRPVRVVDGGSAAAVPQEEPPPRSLPVSLADFVDQELVLFSHADNVRSIPSVVDGLKPSQRKVLYACMKRKLYASEIKVAQLAGYVSEHTAYHHGEASLQSTIVNMAQEFCGANNLPLLYPSGQFGTRLQGGKDAASPRYIFTRLMPVVRALFPAADDALLDYNDDDGFPVEPEFYVPVVPLALVNGCDGIGTGWSTSVPMYNPLDLIDWLEARLAAEAAGEPMRPVPLHPWVRGFTGTIVEKTTKTTSKGTRSYRSIGRISQINSTTVEITELPVGRWTEDMKKILAQMAAKNVVKGYREHHTETEVHFVVSMTRSKLAAMEDSEGGLEKAFKLEQPINTSNMHLFDPNGIMRKYDSPEAIADSFFHVRLEYYTRRRLNQLARMDKKLRQLENKSRFLALVSVGEFELVGRSKPDLEAALVSHGFLPASEEEGDNESEASATVEKGSFDYLLRMPLTNFTLESVQAAIEETDALRARKVALEGMTAEELWTDDLVNLRHEILKLKGPSFDPPPPLGRKTTVGTKKTKTKKKKKKKKANKTAKRQI